MQRDGSATAALGDPWQCLTTLVVDNFFRGKTGQTKLKTCRNTVSVCSNTMTKAKAPLKRSLAKDIKANRKGFSEHFSSRKNVRNM